MMTFAELMRNACEIVDGVRTGYKHAVKVEVGAWRHSADSLETSVIEWRIYVDSTKSYSSISIYGDTPEKAIISLKEALSPINQVQIGDFALASGSEVCAASDTKKEEEIPL